MYGDDMKQTFKGWCIYSPEGKAKWHTFNTIEAYSKMFDRDCDWKTYEKQGYTCRPTILTLEKPPSYLDDKINDEVIEEQFQSTLRGVERAAHEALEEDDRQAELANAEAVLGEDLQSEPELKRGPFLKESSDEPVCKDKDNKDDKTI